jgi:hypothetical protein
MSNTALVSLKVSPEHYAVIKAVAFSRHTTISNLLRQTVQVIPTVGAKLQVVAIWDSGPEAGLDCQVEVRGGHPAGWQAICETGKAEAGDPKADDIQEVPLWHAYFPPDKGIDRVHIVFTRALNCPTVQLSNCFRPRTPTPPRKQQTVGQLPHSGPVFR